MELPEGTAFASYVESGDAYVVAYTETPRAVRGRGFGAKLVRGMLDLIRRDGRKISPKCGFVAAHMRQHPETQDLLAGLSAPTVRASPPPVAPPPAPPAPGRQPVRIVEQALRRARTKDL